ncbi:hypothetical protein [Methanothermococcus okinawensis]|uniref:Roadblock/LC7 family protein n=1 Tax=Methanothermococcus okinawensis (strain DSM 14208 / JCM 11175 / IH1) TaxID=647113 RepID=F8AKP6_METOI|nr:hypothetical protein [Methanothermococcus okinawensis]AEH06379.1 hypothetical protein Metok_0392 [Methanothermococcus okinawensis IH1]
MELIYIFIVALILGFTTTFLVWELNKVEKYKQESKQKEELENEIINGLLELKKHTVDFNNKKLSDKYDLMEIAFENNVSDITIANEEGLPIISTLKDPDEDSAQYSALFQNIDKSLNSNLLKVAIKCEDGHRYIIPIVKNNVKLYIVVSSNGEIDSVSERKLVKDILNVLDNYIPN